MLAKTRACWLIGFAFVWASILQGAVLTRLSVVPDGSLDPPGDRIDVTVLFFPGEMSVDLEVRAFVVGADANRPQAVRSKSPDLRGTRGELLIKTTVQRPEDEFRAVSTGIVVPYASLDLQRGTHRLGYQVTGLINERVDFVRASELAAVRVAAEPRTEVAMATQRAVMTRNVVRRKARVVRPEGVEETEVEIELFEQRPVFEERVARVNIPGGFSRPALAPAPRPRAPGDREMAEAVPLDGRAWDSLARFEPKQKRTMYYATNRNVVKPASFNAERYGAEPGPLSYGLCVVNIPIVTHKRGELELPSWWSGADPQKHFLIESLKVLERDAFREQATGDDILLVVHGYNTKFDFAVLRTAQLVHDLQFPGRGVAFSWPSAGSVSGYFHDETAAQASVPALAELIATLSGDLTENASRPRKIHAIVHSMGNRIFLQAVKQFELDHNTESRRKVFGQVALAAPDVDGATFGALIPSVVRQADHVTLYYCQKDRALETSRTIHQDKPVGLGPCFAEGMDTINAEAVNTEVLGHGYYASAHELLIDLRLLLLYDLLPDQRLPPLAGKTSVLGFSHWFFGPRQ